MLQQSIKVSLTAVSVEELIDLFLTRCCLLPFLPISLHRHPCHTWKAELFGRQIVLRHDDSIKSFEERKDSTFPGEGHIRPI